MKVVNLWSEFIKQKAKEKGISYAKMAKQFWRNKELKQEWKKKVESLRKPIPIPIPTSQPYGVAPRIPEPTPTPLQPQTTKIYEEFRRTVKVPQASFLRDAVYRDPIFLDELEKLTQRIREAIAKNEPFEHLRNRQKQLINILLQTQTYVDTVNALGRDIRVERTPEGLRTYKPPSPIKPRKRPPLKPPAPANQRINEQIENAEMMLEDVNMERTRPQMASTDRIKANRATERLREEEEGYEMRMEDFPVEGSGVSLEKIKSLLLYNEIRKRFARSQRLG
jgi:hypothetical protein